MKISVCSSLLVLLLTITFQLNKAIFPVSKNFIYFERINCRTYDGSKASAVQCRVKYIDRNHLKAFSSANLTEPVTGLWLRAAAYYKYATYQRISTEIWENLCDWIDGKRSSFFMDFLKSHILQYSNFNHSCPYSGFVFGKADNVSAQEFAFPEIMPAGRYRVDINVTEGGRKSLLLGATVYFSVSDHRIEIV
ncbi:uncharacterized protein LOC119065978 [Bradysia coprophila]|uniref:uncharacterized protein LOC119065978 n=1 Tax=Bradysia coprophila TaxID=38358 RepID=UPI00187DA566|nr:uncharacterized protein LOC119065978 [Bradysia coprophila]